MGINIKNLRNLFYIFLAAHLIVWTAIPTLTNNNLPLDTIEALAWGSNLDWGFNKHPPMSAFVVEIFYQIFGPQDWAYYLLSQIFVIISFFVVFKFAEGFFENKFFSLLSVLLLEGIYFYNYTTPEFNVYVCELPFWSLTVFYCWKGLKDNKIIDWLLFGLFAALGVLSKYLFFYLIIAIKIFFIHKIFIKREKIKLKYIIPGSIFILILLPHLIWLIENNYATITYALHRTEIENVNFFKSHFLYPLFFSHL